MKKPIEIALACVLCVSLVINAYLFLREPSAAPATIPPSPPAASPPRETGLLPPDLDRSRPCPDQLAEVESRIAAIAPEVEKRLTPKDKFERGKPDAATVAAIVPIIDKMLADAPDDVGYDVACQNRICRVTVDVGDTDYDWVARLQRREDRFRWGAMMFDGTGAYLELRNPP
jgi:hypothetical protein